MTAAFLTRLHYPPGSRAEWRMAYFEAMTLPRLRPHGIDVCLWVDDWQRPWCERIGCKPFTVRPEFQGHIKPGYEAKAKSYHVDFVPWSAVVGLPRYELQIAIDSDELLMPRTRPGLLERLRRELNSAPPGETCHVSFQHEMFDVQECRLYRSQYRYSIEKGSPLYALWQPEGTEPYVFAYDDSHQRIGQQMQHRRFIADDGSNAWVAASVHEYNASTKRKEDAERIP
jgi:hypothetical protein